MTAAVWLVGHLPCHPRPYGHLDPLSGMPLPRYTHPGSHLKVKEASRMALDAL